MAGGSGKQPYLIRRGSKTHKRCLRLATLSTKTACPPSGIKPGFAQQDGFQSTAQEQPVFALFISMTAAKRRKHWACQAGIFPFPRLRGKVPEGRKGGIKLPSGVNTGLVKREFFPSPVYGGRYPKGGRGIKSSGGVNTGLVKREFFPSPVYGGRCPKGGRGDKVAKAKTAPRRIFLAVFLRRSPVVRAVADFFGEVLAGEWAAMNGGRGLCGVGECHQAAWLLDFVETLPATCQKRKAVQNYSAQCHSCQQCKKQAAPARRAEARPTPAKRRKYWARQALNAALANNAKSRLRPFGGLKPALRVPSGANTGPVKRSMPLLPTMQKAGCARSAG